MVPVQNASDARSTQSVPDFLKLRLKPFNPNIPPFCGPSSPVMHPGMKAPACNEPPTESNPKS